MLVGPRVKFASACSLSDGMTEGDTEGLTFTIESIRGSYIEKLRRMTQFLKFAHVSAHVWWEKAKVSRHVCNGIRKSFRLTPLSS